MRTRAIIDSIIDVADLEYVGNKVYCPECHHPKPFLYATTNGNKCAACLSVRPGKKGSR